MWRGAVRYGLGGRVGLAWYGTVGRVGGGLVARCGTVWFGGEGWHGVVRYVGGGGWHGVGFLGCRV